MNFEVMWFAIRTWWQSPERWWNWRARRRLRESLRDAIQVQPGPSEAELKAAFTAPEAASSLTLTDAELAEGWVIKAQGEMLVKVLSVTAEPLRKVAIKLPFEPDKPAAKTFEKPRGDDPWDDDEVTSFYFPEDK